MTEYKHALNEGSKPPNWPRATFARSAIALLTAFTHSVVVLTAMYYGILTANLLLVYIACTMVAARTSPSILRYLLSLIKEKLPPQKAK